MVLVILCVYVKNKILLHFKPSPTSRSLFSTSRIGLQLSTEELMNTMPLRDTVAGEALSMLCGSNTTLQLGAMGIRSPFAKVRVLLSSKTELRFSIQIASTGPSRTIHMCSPEKFHIGKCLFDCFREKDQMSRNRFSASNDRSKMCKQV